MPSEPSTRTLQVDSVALAAALSQRRAISVTDIEDLPASDSVFAEAFGSPADRRAGAPSLGSERILSGA